MFNLSHYFCSFNSLQISVKVKWLNSKKNPWRRIEFLFEKKAPLHKKSSLIYREVLSVSWPNFTVVKYNLKTSNDYHNVKFGKSIMNRCSIRKLFLKILQYSQKNTCVGVSLLIKMQAFSPVILLKKQAFSVNIAKFLRIPVLKNMCERLKKILKLS